MRNEIHRSLFAVLAALALVFLATSPLVAQTVTFNLTNVGSGDPSLDSIYTSPYTGNINGGPTIPVICDDFADESFIPEEWTAYVTSLSPTSTAVNPILRWGDSNVVAGTAPTVGSVSSYSWSLTQTHAYDVAALLSIDILTSVQGSQAQKDFSYALWGLFDPTDAFAWLNSNGSYTDQSNAETDLNNAIGQVNGAISGGTLGGILGNYNVTIYSYDPPPSAGGTGMIPMCGSPLVGCAANGYSLPPQEFISVTTPEVSTPVLMAVDLLGFMALVGFLRKRISRTI